MQRVTDLADDVTELRDTRKEDHHRLRSVEATVNLLLDAQQDARRAEARQYQRLELRIGVLTVVLAAAAVVVPIVVAVVATH
jgi:hypothetical protein